MGADFTISADSMPLGYAFKEAPVPWFITIIAVTGKSYAKPLILAFKKLALMPSFTCRTKWYFVL